MLTEILFLIALILLMACFNITEAAIISLNEHKISQMAEERNRKARILTKLLNDPTHFLATMKIGITLTAFLTVAYAAEEFSVKIADFLLHLGVMFPNDWLVNISIFIVVMIVAFFILIFGEMVPKRLAAKRTASISEQLIGFFNFLSVLLTPFVKLLMLFTSGVLWLLSVDPNQEEDEFITEQEIRMLVDIGEENGTIHETEKEMINNIFDFDNKTVTDIMTHRTDIIAIHVDASLKQTISLVNEEKYTRFPVYENSIDNIVGILHVKDLIQYIDFDSDGMSFDLRKIVRSPYFVPSSKMADDLFHELQKSKTHIAVIVDEYGGTAGIVTIDNLMEEIVGDIYDEYDEDETDYEKIDDNTYIFNGSTVLDAIEDTLNTHLPIEEYETISGFLIGQLGRIPGEGEQPEIEFNGMVFKVESVGKKRIERVKVWCA